MKKWILDVLIETVSTTEVCMDTKLNLSILIRNDYLWGKSIIHFPEKSFSRSLLSACQAPVWRWPHLFYCLFAFLSRIFLYFILNRWLVPMNVLIQIIGYCFTMIYSRRKKRERERTKKSLERSHWSNYLYFNQLVLLFCLILLFVYKIFLILIILFILEFVWCV
jgi:hypothetical protein